MISIRRLVKLTEQGLTAHEIAAQQDIPVAMVWRELLRHYKGLYLTGRATVEDAERRIVKAEERARRAHEAAVHAQNDLYEERERQRAAAPSHPDSVWRERLRKIALEASPARRLELLNTPLPGEPAPGLTIDLRTHTKAAELEA